MNARIATVVGYNSFKHTPFYGTYQPCEMKHATQSGADRPGAALPKGEAKQSVTDSLNPQEPGQEELDRRGAKNATEAAMQAKDRFLAILSHELRTPLTPVFSAVHLLMDDPDISDQNKILLGIIEGNIGIEMRLIEDLLDMTRLAHGKIILQLKPIDAHDIISKAVAVCMSDIKQKNISITVSLEASNATINGDPVRLQQVIWNLLKNSAKFTSDGGNICIRTRNDESEHLLIEVIDNGIGIDPQILPIIFNAFEQGEKSITENFGGLGLGLAISRMLTEMLGGRICASSKGRGHGATFMVEMNTIPKENEYFRLPS